MLLTAVAAAEPLSERLLNLSSRAWVGDGFDVVIAGFVIEPGPEKQILVRAVGPELGRYGVPRPVQRPELQIVNLAGEVVASNEGWSPVLEEAFATVGAFGLTADSDDAALVALLPPGVYTAVAKTGQNGGFGNGLIEVYDLEGSARLRNLSTRARIESDSTVVIGGLVVGSEDGGRRVLLRAVGPSLIGLAEADRLADPIFSLVRQSDGVEIAGNDDWQTGNDAAALSDAFATAGAFPLENGAKDAALLIDLPGGAYTLLVSGANGSAGTALVEVYDITPQEGAFVTAAATVASTDSAPGSLPGQITLNRVGDLSGELTVNLGIGGSAQMGSDYAALPSAVTFAPGQAAVSLHVTSTAGISEQQIPKDVIVSVLSGDGYAPGSTAKAEVTIFNSTGTLYLAKLQPLVAGSGAYGTVAIQLSADESTLVVSASFSNLSSPQTAAYLQIGSPGDAGELLISLPKGQANNNVWPIEAVGGYSPADVLDALRSGRIFANVSTANFPTGELEGTARRYAGSHAFTAPAAVPAAPTMAVDAADAARFLTQTTFGPTRADTDALVGQAFATWIDAQMALPASNHEAETYLELERHGDPNFDDRPDRQHRYGAFWNIALRGEDQLRQRVALALSEILVASDSNGTVYNWQEGLANYHDVLAEHAFGNFRDLLEDVTLHPIMGVYLSHLRNTKADPATGSVPDENFAREIMQLFSIGLVELHPDGTLKLNGNGLPIQTYDQTTITEMAKVFTGWTFVQENPQDWMFRWGQPNYQAPMMNYPAFHEDGAKTIVTGRELPAGQGAIKDLNDTLDTLFEHPNTGPFISRQLIQRLITSNPSPGYVYRVAQVFANNGAGERGDLAAVVKAILLDHEARSPDVAASPNFGKVREPMIRMIGLWRAMGVEMNSGQIYYFWSTGELAQGPLSAPSVFNFFRPDYAPVGDLARAGLFAPELQIHTDATAISVPNRLAVYAYSNWGANPEREEDDVWLTINDVTALWPNAEAVVDELDIRLSAGSMSPATRTRILTAVDQLPSWLSADQAVSALIYLVATSPESAVQR
jgi:uncharacterized protein (DUF1800 family)